MCYYYYYYYLFFKQDTFIVSLNFNTDINTFFLRGFNLEVMLRLPNAYDVLMGMMSE